jgi:Domain of unknown function (DUF4062)
MGRALRVFISSTSELSRYPHEHDSYVGAAREAVQQAEHVVEHMTLWGAHEAPPVDVCRERVRACDVYVGVVGHRYGSIVPDDPEGRSYTQFEFDTAGDAGRPRLVFLLGDRLETPYDKEVFTDASHGELQAAFRKVVLAQTTAVTVASPDDLKFAIYKSLRELGEVGTIDREVEAPPYLAGLTDHDRERLQEINREGLAYLRARLDKSDAVAVVGPGASAALYPVWPGLVARLLAEAPLRPEDRDRISLFVGTRPAAALAALRQLLDRPRYVQALGGIFQQRRDGLTGRRYTRAQAAVVRRPFKGVITTSPDPGLRLARNALRTDSTMTSFATWESVVQLDRWTPDRSSPGPGSPYCSVTATSTARRASCSTRPTTRATAYMADPSGTSWIASSDGSGHSSTCAGSASPPPTPASSGHARPSSALVTWSPSGPPWSGVTSCSSPGTRACWAKRTHAACTT